MTDFRHKCPPEINPKRPKTVENGEYGDHIRKLYPVPEDAWVDEMGGDARQMRMNMLEPTGRQIAFVTCPDCGADVVAMREKPSEQHG